MNAKAEIKPRLSISTKPPKADKPVESTDKHTETWQPKFSGANVTQVKDKFVGEAKAANMSQSEYLEYLMTSRNNSSESLFDDKSKVTIDEAAKKHGLTFDAVVVSGALKYAVQLNNADLDKPVSNVDLKIHQLVESIMKSNEAAKEWHERSEITQGFLTSEYQRVYSVGENKGNVNRTNLSRYLTANADRIAEHHKLLGIEPDHNRKVFNYNRKNKKGE